MIEVSPTRIASIAVALSFVASNATAQNTRIWPIPYQSQPGEGAMSAPFTLSAAHPRRNSRATTTVHASSVPFGVGSTIDEIAFRRDEQDPASYAATSGYCEVRMGPTVSAEDPWANPQQVLQDDVVTTFRANLNLPAANPPSSGTAPFTLVIPFDTSWTYAGGDFAFEVFYEGSASALWRRDAVQIEDREDGRYQTRGGHGVFGTHGYAPMQWIEPDLAVPGGELVFHLTGAPPTYPFGAALQLLGHGGSTFQGQTLPIQLPTDQYPGGALEIHVLLWQLQLTSDFSGEYARSTARWPVPTSTGLTGLTFASQWLVLDPANSAPLPLLTSSALEVDIGTASTTESISYGRTLWSYGAPEQRRHYYERSPRNYVPVTRFGGTFSP